MTESGAGKISEEEFAAEERILLKRLDRPQAQLRLVICSVDKAKEMGIDWWVNNPIFRRQEDQRTLASSLASIEERLARPEATFTKEETRTTQLVSPSHSLHVP